MADTFAQALKQITLRLSQLAFGDGTVVDIAPNGIVVIVGPNNSGKSSVLKGVASQLLRNESGYRSPLSSMRTTVEPSIDETVSLLTRFGDEFKLGDNTYHRNHYDGLIDSERRSHVSLPDFLLHFFLAELSTEARLGACRPANLVDMRDTARFQHPFQAMYHDSSLEERASAAFNQAFGIDLIVHRANAQNIPAYVGPRPELNPGEHHHSRSYLDRLEGLERLEDQGDGMRSFASIVCKMECDHGSLILVDEPEAFLHPPQARQIGSYIASASSMRQTVVATHSSDFLQGVLSVPNQAVTVIRLSREGSNFSARSLLPGEIGKLWKDPILRFSNVLDGLFHDGVIVCEGDADCRFFQALGANTPCAGHRPDVLYTYSGGKDRVDVVVRSLLSSGVRVASVLDFDVLNNEQPLKKIVEAHGGNWNDFVSPWQTVKNAVEQNGSHIKARQLGDGLRAIAKRLSGNGAVDKEVLRDIRKLAKDASPWDVMKKAGLAALGNGTEYLAGRELLQRLAGLGLFVIPVGEMEAFDKRIVSQKSRWVEEVLQADLANDPALSAARDFAGQLTAFIKQR